MTVNLLQMKKALSVALFVLLLVAGTKNALAQTQVATLQHGDDISVFYGTNAFVDAYTTAVDGDIVTLSGGSFTTPMTITKAITLRGAGAVRDTVAGTNPTVFSAGITIDIDNTTIPFQMEGILLSGTIQFGRLNNPVFTKCNFIELKPFNMNKPMTNARFINCKISSFRFEYSYNTTIINSVVWDASDIGRNYTVVTYNTILSVSGQTIYGLSAYNSIVISSNNYLCSSPCSFFNCIGVGNDNPFGTGFTSDCVSFDSLDEVFDSFTGSFSFGQSFVLKDEIVASFHGNDGTQVGIYGGFLPYNSRPTYMLMKRCNVANRSTIDGKLSVDIEVVAEGE